MATPILVRALLAAAWLAGGAGCALFPPPPAKFCGRDWGDRVHWTPAPRWFAPKDCAQLNPDAQWSDLYLGCYTSEAGFSNGNGGLAQPAPNRCGWGPFDPNSVPAPSLRH